MSGASATYLKIHQKLVSNLSTKHFKALADSFNERFIICNFVLKDTKKLLLSTSVVEFAMLFTMLIHRNQEFELKSASAYVH